MKFDLEFKSSGEYMAVVHSGHQYDAEGNITKEGGVLRKSGWGKNLITLAGFNAQLSNTNGVTTCCVVGSGNTPPAESDTLLQAYLGRYTSQLVRSYTVTGPDGNGYYAIEKIIRATFNPGALGSGAVNIAEAGMAMHNSPNSTTPLFSRGLLVDAFGAPTVVSMNASTEYLDVYWKYTRYVPAEIIGTQDIDILGVMTPHNYIIRPTLIDPSHSQHNIWWGLNGSPTSPASVPSLHPVVSNTSFSGRNYGPRMFDVDIANANQMVIGGNETMQTSYTVDTYVSNSKERTFSLNLGPTDGNLAAFIRSATLKWNMMGFQMQFDPRLEKNATPARVLRLDFKAALANR